MKKNYGIIVKVILIILTLFFTLVIPNKYTPQIWTVILFDIITFGFSIAIGIIQNKNTKEVFYKYPLILLLMSYLGLQMIFSIVVAMMNEIVSFKTVLIIDFTFSAVIWLFILLTLMVKEKIESLDSRQTDNHIKLYEEKE